MKKIVLSVFVLTLFSTTGYSYPSFDLTPANMPFQFMQQQKKKKMELDSYRQFKDAYDNPVEERNASPEEIQAEYEEIQNMKQPTKIQLGQPKQNQKLINDNGKIKIQNSED